MQFKEHVSHHGFGWIDPLMDQDDPLIFRDTAETIIAAFDLLRDCFREVDWHNACSEHPEMRNWFS